MGRKKIVKSALTAFKAVVRPIITFIDEEESECLLHPAEPLRLVLHKSKIEQDVASLKLTASNVGAVALAANQIESSINAFVMNRRAHETTGNWLDDIYNKPEDY